MLLMLLLGLLQITGPTDNNLAQKSQAQAKYYISNIEDGNNIDANLWALTTLTTNNKEVQHFVENELKENEYTQSPLSLFQEIKPDYTEQLSRIVFDTGSPNLFVALLFSTETTKKRKELFAKFNSKFEHFRTESIDFTSLCRSIIEEKEITDASLPNEKFHLAHFFILFDGNYKKLIGSEYLKTVTQNWSSITSNKANLNTTLAIVTHLRVLYLLDSYSQTASLYNKLANDQLFPTSPLKLRIYRYLDYSMYRLGYYDRSLEIVRDFTLPLTNIYGSETSLLSIKISQATYLYNIGKVKEAKSIFEEVIKQANEGEIQLPETIIFNNLALAYYKMGNYDKYLKLQHEALNTATEKNDYEHQIKIYNNLFIYYKQSSHPEKALDYITKAQKLAQEKNKKTDIGNIYTLLGSFYADIKADFQQADIFFQKAKQTLDPKNHAKYYIDLLKVQEKIYKKQGFYDLALKNQDEIISLSPSENSRNHIDALVNKALIYLEIQNLNKAKSLITKFKSLDLTQLDFQQIIKAKTVEADYLSRVSQTQKALNILEPALDQVLVRAKSSTDLKSGFWHVEDEYLDAFELAVSIYINEGQPRKAVEKLDQLKTINDASFYQNPLVKSSLLNESELTQYKQLTNQLDATRKRLLTTPKSQHFDIRQTISQLKLKKRKLDRKLTKDVDSDHINVKEVQNKLSAHDLVLHISELKDQYYIAQISRSDVSIKTIPLDNDLRKLLSGSAEQIATHETNLDSLYKISRVLGMEKIPDRIDEITVIPDSYFYQLPIDVLPLEQPQKSYSYGEVTYVIENFRTHYLTSLNDFQHNTELKSRSSNPFSYVGYGVSNFSGYNTKSLVPLPFAQTEVTSIAEKLTHLSNRQTYLNEESTKSAFKNTAPKASIIHLATHSQVSERDPMFSTVYLSKNSHSPDSTFDDQIFAYELFELNLSNEMIMLNSCESGSGSYIQGTGVMGIGRALQYAGAESLILNLWSVNDMLASDFAIHFYDQLNQGKSKAEALQNTKRYFLRTKNASPHFWGPYMLIGNTDPIVEPNQDKNLAMAGTFIFYFLLMVGLSYLTQKGIIFQRLKDNAS